jgi:hypothetical protein
MWRLPKRFIKVTGFFARAMRLAGNWVRAAVASSSTTPPNALRKRDSYLWRRDELDWCVYSRCSSLPTIPFACCYPRLGFKAIAAHAGSKPRAKLARVLFITPRPSMPPGSTIMAGQKAGNGTTDYACFNWARGHVGPAKIG